MTVQFSTSRPPADAALRPPSSNLPALSRLSSLSLHHISRALDDLKSLYFPPKTHTSPMSVLPSNLVLPTRKLKHLRHTRDYSVPDSGYASAEDDEDEDGGDFDDFSSSESLGANETTEILRADPFERAVAIQWVTGFIARADVWVEEAGEEADLEAEKERGLEQGEWKRRLEMVDKATAILSQFIGGEGLGEKESAVTRSFSFLLRNSAKGEVRYVNVELNDDPLDNEDHTSVGLQSWASAIVLSEKMCADPEAFSLGPLTTTNTSKGGERILELGAGTGLLSIVAAKICEQQRSMGQCNTIIATDFHPDVLANCARNVETNFATSLPVQSSPIFVHKLDWEHPEYSDPVEEPFDLILAADVIYHPDHAKWIRGVVEKLLRKPSLEALSVTGVSGAENEEQKGGIFWMMMAVRITGRHEGLDKTVDEVFPDFVTITSSASLVSKSLLEVETLYEDEWHLAITHRSEVAKQGGVGRADEGGYKLFGIEWVKAKVECQ